MGGGNRCRWRAAAAALCFLAFADCQWSEPDDPLRQEARRLVAAVGDFLGGKGSAQAVNQLQHFLMADAQDLAQAGRGGAGAVMHMMGLKDGGWRRHVAFEAGALPLLTDVVSEVGEPGPAAAAARSLAMLAAASSRAREAATSVGTVRLLIKMASSPPKKL
jgi:hypothetical protein